MANRSAWTRGAGWGRTGEAPMGLLPSPPLSLLPCSREAWGLLGGEGQLVVITHRLRRRWARLGAFWDRERLGDSCQNVVWRTERKAGILWEGRRFRVTS